MKQYSGMNGRTSCRAALFAFFVVALSGCAVTPWGEREYEDCHALVREIHDEAVKLAEGKTEKEGLIPLLRDRRPIFKEEGGATVTVRDAAFTVLEAAGLVEMPVDSAPVKMICGCEVEGEWYRYHIPELTDENFETILAKIR